jgi:transcriptional regulator with GAF, ATPase, and Fis domain
VRTFAGSAQNVAERDLRSLVKALLRETGEALNVDCCAFLPLAEGEHPPLHYQWCRTLAPASRLPFDDPAFEQLVQHLEREHRPVVLTTAEDAEAEDTVKAEAGAYLRRTPVRTAIVIPTGMGARPTWAWVLGVFDEGHVWVDQATEHLQLLGDLVAGVLQRYRLERPAVDAGAPALLNMRPYPAPTPRIVNPARPQFDEIIGESPSLRAALDMLEEVVNMDSSVLLLGETGTGKELFARALHARGPRRAFPLVSVNCAALPPTLIESELFGHQRGAFTGAIAPRQGRFEAAHRGSLFLDEIGDLPLDLQAKLLRVLQEGAFERVGSSQTQAVDVRIIAATHRDIGRAVAEGEFRADLYYRLNVFPIRLPPLRERREDIPALVWSIIRKRQNVLQRQITVVPDEVMDALRQHSWPGNIRELENVVERALIHSTGDTLTLRDGSFDSAEDVPETGTTLMSVERAHIEEVLRDCGWRINGIGNAAERLGLHPNTLRFRMKKLGIVRSESIRHAPARPASQSEARGRAS